jgi:transposase-like protein
MLPDSLPTLSVASDSADFPLTCPVTTCAASHAELVVRSSTIVTFRCATCAFTWSVEIDDLPTSLRHRLQARPYL